MLDPFSCLSIATGAVQFIDFASKLISKGIEIHHSAHGMSVEHLELEAVAENMLQLSKTLQTAEQRTSSGGFFGSIDLDSQRARRHMTTAEIKEQERQERMQRQLNENIHEICQACNKSAGEFLVVIDDLKIAGKQSGWRSFRQALCEVWGSVEVEALAKRLDRLRAQLNSNLMSSIRQQIEAVESRQMDHTETLNNLDHRTQAVLDRISTMARTNESWQTEILTAIYRQGMNEYDSNGLRALSEGLSKQAKAQWANLMAPKLINRLRFPGMFERHARISQAHRRTFDWIYLPPDAEKASWSNFITFLEEDSDLYWITGKPGSGKSTLMKYLSDNHHTMKHSRQWSGNTELLRAGFFFWNSGSDMQMSELGLIQTLLYECLNQKPNLVQVVFPDRWRMCELYGDDLHPWTWDELLQGFKTFCKIASQSSKLLFFIDGLDEFHGKHEDLIELVQTLAKSPNIKVCVSSRPWLVFEDAFKTGASLLLEDLTFSDIATFVESQLSANRHFKELRIRDLEQARNLEIQIAKKSRGVFLWVRLVVESLLQGLMNSDRLSDLQKRLDLIPSDLDGFYASILDHLDPFYFEHASQLFQILREAQGSLSLLDFSLADEEDPDTAIKAEIQILSHKDRAHRCETMRRRINSRTKGLLDVPTLEHHRAEAEFLQVVTTNGLNRTPSAGSARSGASGCRSSHYKTGKDPYESYSLVELDTLKVEYLHRTVKDFLQAPAVWRRIENGTHPPFDPCLSLAQAFLMKAKDNGPDRLTGVDENMWHIIEKCDTYIRKAESRTSTTDPALSRELERVAREIDAVPLGAEFLTQSDRQVRVVTTDAKKNAGSRSFYVEWKRSTIAGAKSIEFLSFAEQTGLFNYVEQQLRSGVLFPQDRDERPLLSYALLDFEPFAVLRLRLITALLENGVSPNQEYRNASGRMSTPWKDVLAQLQCDRMSRGVGYELVISRWADIIELFLHHGAEKADVSSSGRLFEELLSTVDAQKGRELDALCQTEYAPVKKKESLLRKVFHIRSKSSKKLE